jgi:hypothetical protein
LGIAVSPSTQLDLYTRLQQFAGYSLDLYGTEFEVRPDFGVLKKLADTGELENTIIVYFNDYGQLAKGTVYEGGIHTDLGSDPTEKRNLAGDPKYCARLAEMKADLGRHLAPLPGSFAELKPGE